MMKLVAEDLLAKEIPVWKIIEEKATMLYRVWECDMCREELLPICQKEHPEWFTPKKKEIKSSCINQVYNWQEKHIKKTYCLFTDHDVICSHHLRFIAEELEALSANKDE